MEQLRAFIAIELPAELKLGLKKLQAQLKAGRQIPVKWVDPDGIHLTLKFLGNISPDTISDINGAMTEAAQGINPLNLEVKDLGVFPNLNRVQVAWVGLSGELDRLGQLQQRLESNLAPFGFPPESRRFTPHLTLARVRDRASREERQTFGQLVTDTTLETDYRFMADSVHLIRSQLTREGSIYTRISSVNLM